MDPGTYLSFRLFRSVHYSNEQYQASIQITNYVNLRVSKSGMQLWGLLSLRLSPYLSLPGTYLALPYKARAVSLAFIAFTAV